MGNAPAPPLARSTFRRAGAAPPSGLRPRPRRTGYADALSLRKLALQCLEKTPGKPRDWHSASPRTAPSAMTGPLENYFRSAAPLARLGEHAARLGRLQSILAGALPPHLAECCAVANVKEGELVLHARSGAVAARLRQMLPSLVHAFAEQGVLLTGIKLRVEVTNPQPSRPATAPRNVSSQARGGLAGLAEALPAQSPLAQALRRFVRRTGTTP